MLLEAQSLTKQYAHGGFLSRPETSTAVQDVDLLVEAGSVTALVGASGSGKSTLARCLIGLERPTRGRVVYRGQDLSRLNKGEMRQYRRKVQLVFQEAAGTLSPRFTAALAVSEPLRIAGAGSRGERRGAALRWMQEVGLPPEAADRPALEFSGGQRQRLAIARALTLYPEVLIFDEALSALDLPVQIRILELLNQLRSSYHLTYIFISHDLSLLARICEDVAVMQCGRVVETTSMRTLLSAPAHPYSQELVRAIPRLQAGYLT